MNSRNNNNEKPGSTPDRINGPAAGKVFPKYQEYGQEFEVKRRDQNFTTPECTDHSAHGAPPLLGRRSQTDVTLPGAGKVPKEEYVGKRFEIRREEYPVAECTDHDKHTRVYPEREDQTSFSAAGKVPKEEYTGKRFEIRREKYPVAECTDHDKHVREPTYPDRRLIENNPGQQVHKAQSKEAIAATDTPYQNLARRGGSRSNLIQQKNLELSEHQKTLVNQQVGANVNKVKSKEQVTATDTPFQNLARRGGSRSDLFQQDNIDNTREERRLIDQEVGRQVHRSRENIVAQDTEYQRLARRGGSRSDILGQEPRKY